MDSKKKDYGFKQKLKIVSSCLAPWGKTVFSSLCCVMASAVLPDTNHKAIALRKQLWRPGYSSVVKYLPSICERSRFTSQHH